MQLNRFKSMEEKKQFLLEQFMDHPFDFAKTTAGIVVKYLANTLVNHVYDEITCDSEIITVKLIEKVKSKVS